MNMGFEDYGLRSYIAEASTQRVSPLMIKTNTTKRIRAFNKTALVNHAIRIISLQDKLDRIDNRQLFSTNLRVPATGPFHSRGVRILKVIATCLCYVNVLLGPGIIIYIKPAVVRKRTEMTMSHNHMLER